MRETVKIGDNELRDRIYDAWVEIDGVLTKVEAKSWIASACRLMLEPIYWVKEK